MSLYWISVRRRIGAGKRKVISASVKTSAARFCGTNQASVAPMASVSAVANSHTFAGTSGRNAGIRPCAPPKPRRAVKNGRANTINR